jgi:hypothetical protein
LPGERAGDRVHHAGELHQQPVAHELYDASMMFGDERFEDVMAQFSHASKRAGFVDAHQGGVADHVGGENCGEPAFHALSPSIRRLTARDERIHVGEKTPGLPAAQRA